MAIEVLRSVVASGPLETKKTLKAVETIRGELRTSAGGMTLLSEVTHNLHPEDEGTCVLPYYSNDLAYLLMRGGSVAITSGHTPNSGTAGDLNNLFDCGTVALAFNVSKLTNPPVVFEVTVHRVFRYTNAIGFSGGSGFRAKNFTIETRDAVTGVWTQIASKTDYRYGTFTRVVNSGRNGFDRIRYSFSNFHAPSTFRLSQFFVMEYKSALGRDVFVTRDYSSILGSLTVGHENITPTTMLAVNGDAGPYNDDGGNCGVAGKRWSQIYAVSGTINTSDARLKTQVRPLEQGELAAAMALSREIGIFQWLNALAHKGDAARLHTGVTVQRVIEIMQAHGLDPMRYGMVCYDQWDARTVEHPAEIGEDADGREIELAPARTEVVQEAGDRYSLRYDQLLAFAVRGLAERIARLEGQNDSA